jgi:hypothetical protein
MVKRMSERKERKDSLEFLSFIYFVLLINTQSFLLFQRTFHHWQRCAEIAYE